MSDKFVINIGRQLGSGGREVGEKLAARLGISFYDKELISLASEESGLCREFFERADEKASQGGIIGGLLGMRFPFVSENTVCVGNCLSSDSLFQVQSDVIRHLAEERSCLFVGRCADYILRDHPHSVNIFISSSVENRVARLCRNLSITPAQAEELIEKTDKRRSAYYHYYTFKTWGAAQSYHLCVDSSQLGIEETVQFIEEFVRRRLSMSNS